MVETIVVTTSAVSIRPLPFPWTEWQNPSAAYRGKPFWSWNGQLEPAELIRQIGIDCGQARAWLAAANLM